MSNTTADNPYSMSHSMCTPRRQRMIASSAGSVSTSHRMAMRPLVRVAASVVLLASTMGAANAAPDEASTRVQLSPQDQASYATGVSTARNLLKNGVDLDFDNFVRGLRDAAANAPLALSEKELGKVLDSMASDIHRRQTNDMRVRGSMARERGQIFQRDYASRPGTNQLPGKVLYKELASGSGARPGPASTVLVNFKTSLVDGTQVDASPAGKPSSMKMAEALPGLRTALGHMTPGTRWELVLPSQAAYGPRGSADGKIGPNETLVVQLELVAISDH